MSDQMTDTDHLSDRQTEVVDTLREAKRQMLQREQHLNSLFDNDDTPKQTIKEAKQDWEESLIRLNVARRQVIALMLPDELAQLIND